MGKAVQEAGTVNSNPLAIETPKAKRMVEALNSVLCTSSLLYHQYKKHHWVVTGPEFMPMHKFFDELAEESLKSADTVAERLVGLGGVPVSSPSAQEKGALVGHEEEGIFDLSTMLLNDLKCEQQFIQKLREYVKLAKELNDFGTEEYLESILMRHEEHAHNLDHFLVREGLPR